MPPKKGYTNIILSIHHIITILKLKKKNQVAKKKNGYQIPEKFDEGFVLKDGFKANWTLGKPIGQGGFGLIYLGI